MRPDEAMFLRSVLEYRSFPENTSRVLADEIGDRLRMHSKRVNYILLKWTDKGWWNYGVSARSGWLTDAGRLAAAAVRP